MAVEQTDQLANLLSYTVFHIGVYVSLMTALIGAGIFAKLDHCLLRLSVAFFVVAGVCGAAIGSNIPDFATWDEFSKAKLGFWSCKLWSYKTWTTIEHLAFWAGILPLAFTFVFRGPRGFRTKTEPVGP